MIKILENEIDFDFNEVVNMAKFENALDEYMKELEELKAFKGKESDEMMKLCEIVYKLFDKTIRDGISKEIFGENHNIAKCLEAAGQLIKAKEDSIKDTLKTVDKYTTKEA